GAILPSEAARRKGEVDPVIAGSGEGRPVFPQPLARPDPDYRRRCERARVAPATVHERVASNRQRDPTASVESVVECEHRDPAVVAAEGAPSTARVDNLQP